MRVCANVSMLFREVPFLERFGLAARAGFRAVEMWWPRGEEGDLVRGAVHEAHVEVAVMNFDGGDLWKGERGFLSDPEQASAFRAHVPYALELAREIGCRRLNALVGERLSTVPAAEQFALAVDNVRYAADLAAELGREVLIEALNTFDNGPYLLSTTADAAAFVRAVSRGNVRLQYDVYHMQQMEGNLAATIRMYGRQIAHVQIADVPGRHEPGTGTIDYREVFHALQAIGYEGYVGLEYHPRQTTEAGLAWLSPDQRSGVLDVERVWGTRR